MAPTTLSRGKHFIEVSASTKATVDALCLVLKVTPDQLITRLVQSLSLVAQEPPDPPIPPGGSDEDEPPVYDPTVPPSNPPITIETPDWPSTPDRSSPWFGDFPDQGGDDDSPATPFTPRDSSFGGF